MEDDHLMNTVAFILRQISKRSPIFMIGKNNNIPGFIASFELEMERRNITAKFLLHIGEVRALVRYVKEHANDYHEGT